ncbi:4'-phosphopantetheinyl transferase superfamily protein [Bacillus subtilis]
MYDKVHAYSIWTEKEAYLKCTGNGFALSPNSFTLKK